MKRILSLVVVCLILLSVLPIQSSASYATPLVVEKENESLIQNLSYDGDLGAIYSKKATTFRVWAPNATSLTLNLYKAGDGGVPEATLPMASIESGVWETIKSGDLNGKYYTYTVESSGNMTEMHDPYAKAGGVNGDRSMVIDFDRTNPKKWTDDRGPIYKKNNDLIVYEVHIRDLTIHDTSNVKNKGKYLGVLEDNTITSNGIPTGLSHLKGLGITHVQIMPMFDFKGIDETRLSDKAHNWGYDPKNASVPEGSYATDPYRGDVRVSEMKRMIKGLHDNGIGVIMDVVYSVSTLSMDSNPVMARKQIVDSLKHWVTEYHIDGFRFDKMGDYDIETMRVIEAELLKINPNIILYGEGLTQNLMAIKRLGTYNIAFNDGTIAQGNDVGFIGGASGFEENVKFGIVGAVHHPQIDYARVNDSKEPWTKFPSQSVNYVATHDGYTLWDKFKATNTDTTEAQRIAMQKLANAIVLTSQGMPLLQLGDDFLRTKAGVDNSNQSPDVVNAIDWTLKDTNGDVYLYYKGLIGIRKGLSAFTLESAEEIAEALTFFSEDDASIVKLPKQMIGYKIDAKANEEKNLNLFVFFNGSLDPQPVTLPEGSYRVLANDQFADVHSGTYIEGGSYVMPGSTALILEASTSNLKSSVNKNSNNFVIVLLIVIAVIIVSIGSVYLVKNLRL